MKKTIISALGVALIACFIVAMDTSTEVALDIGRSMGAMYMQNPF